MSLKFRLALLVGGLTALVCMAGSIFMVHQISHGLVKSAIAVLKDRALALASTAPGLGAGGVDVNLIQVGQNSQISTQADIRGTPFTVSVSYSSVTLVQFLTPKGSVLAHYGSAQSVLSPAQVKDALIAPATYVGTLGGIVRNQLVLAEAVDGSVNQVIVVASPLSPIQAEVNRMIWFLIVFGIAACAVSSGAGYLLARAALKPVDRMREVAAAMSNADDFESLVVPGSNDELAHLGTTLNDLLARIARSNSRQRGFVATAGHEIRTPLSILKIELELAGRIGRTASEMRSAIANAAVETDRLIVMSEQLLTLAKGDEAQLAQTPITIPVRTALSEIVASFANLASRSQVSLKLLDGIEITCLCDISGFRQVMSNILDNAIRFSPFASTVEISANLVSGGVEIKVSDQGPGFDHGLIDTAFERFTRSHNYPDGAYGGSGLGLSVVKSILAANGGNASLGNNSDSGAWVAVLLPIAPLGSDSAP